MKKSKIEANYRTIDREVDEFLQYNAEYKNVIVESHPEVKIRFENTFMV